MATIREKTVAEAAMRRIEEAAEQLQRSSIRKGEKLTRQMAIDQVLRENPHLYAAYQSQDGNLPLSEAVRKRERRVRELKTLAELGASDWGGAVDCSAKAIAKSEGCTYVEALDRVRLALPAMWAQYQQESGRGA